MIKVAGAGAALNLLQPYSSTPATGRGAKGQRVSNMCPHPRPLSLRERGEEGCKFQFGIG